MCVCRCLRLRQHIKQMRIICRIDLSYNESDESLLIFDWLMLFCEWRRRWKQQQQMRVSCRRRTNRQNGVEEIQNKISLYNNRLVSDIFNTVTRMSLNGSKKLMSRTTRAIKSCQNWKYYFFQTHRLSKKLKIVPASWIFFNHNLQDITSKTIELSPACNLQIIHFKLKFKCIS